MHRGAGHKAQAFTAAYEKRAQCRTEEAIGGLEIVPRRQAGGHDGTAGMDLDAVLTRRPAVVLVDDFGQNAAAISSPPDVLVAIPAEAQADAPLQRGVRLARPSGATCTVLVLGRSGRAPTEDEAAAVRSAVNDAGAVLMVREGRDDAATIAQAVRDSGARHLVLAGTAARLLERWRPSLAERLADQLPDVHLHITASQAGSAGRSAEGGTSPAGVPGAGRGPARGAVRVYLGYAAGCGPGVRR